ncbi:hypothetical protein NE645_17200, partial [Roseburia hominis]|nr:hypothetical protein [Roseburia hominis]
KTAQQNLFGLMTATTLTLQKKNRFLSSLILKKISWQIDQSLEMRYRVDPLNKAHRLFSLEEIRRYQKYAKAAWFKVIH